MYNEAIAYFGHNWAGKSLFISVFFYGHYFLICYLHNRLGNLRKGVSFFDPREGNLFGLINFAVIVTWFFCYYATIMTNTDKIGGDFNTNIEIGFLKSLFNLILMIVVGLFDVVVALVGIPLSFLVIYIGIPVVLIYFAVTIPLVCYGLFVTAHYYLIRHPGEEFLNKERPDITGFKQAMRRKSKEKMPAYVSENYRRRAKKATDNIKAGRDKTKQAQRDHDAEIERQKIQAEIAELQEKERQLTEKYGTKEQREHKQALNEQETEMMKKFKT